jgi:hypothetical protein
MSSTIAGSSNRSKEVYIYMYPCDLWFF